MCASGARCRCGRAPLLRPMGCNIRARQRVGGRDRGCMHDSWKIYTNEAADCRKEVEALRARREASVLVRKHLASELDEARRRVELAQHEVELIEAQIEQQRDKVPPSPASSGFVSPHGHLLVADSSV
jgi:hypothetical protein